MLRNTEFRSMAEIRQYRKEHFSREGRVFLLNEGVCPDCFHDAEIINLGGSEGFMEAWAHLENVVRNYWCEHPELDQMVVGSITFKCMNKECAHEHYIEQTKYGDWA